MACPNAIMSDMPAEYALQYATSANLQQTQQATYSRHLPCCLKLD